MKAAVCYEFGKPLVVEDIEIDEPEAGEVKVKMAACAVCHSDITYMSGAWGGTLPSVFGHEAAGVVEAVGPGVTRLRPSDPVIVSLLRSCGECFYCDHGEHTSCETVFPLDEASRLHGQAGETIKQGLRTGAFAEYVVVDESQAVVMPKDLPLDSASLLACGVITGLGAVVNTAKVRPGDAVVIIGTGGVGLNSVQGAQLSGAHPIIALDLAEDKLEAAKAFGATHGLSPLDNDLPGAVRDLTDGRGADYVFVTVGSTKAIEQGLTLLRPGGSLVIVGMPPSGATVAFEPLDFADASQKILGSKMGGTKLQVDVPKLVALYQQGRLKLDELITGRYALEDINDAIESVKRGEALRNVIVF